jgi:hypothetical protein
LITVVLAVQVLEAKGSSFAFITELAFAVILVTNFMAIIASVRAKPVRVPPEIAEVAEEGSQDESDPTVATLAPISGLKVRVLKWRWDALLLVGLVLGGVVLWYGKHGTGSRGQMVRSWIAQRIHH